MRLTDDIKPLILKFIQESLSADEQDTLRSWLDESAEHRAFVDDLLQKEELMRDLQQWISLQESDTTDWSDRLKSRTLTAIHAQEKPGYIRKIKRLLPYAAACCIALSGLTYMLVKKQRSAPQNLIALQDIEVPSNQVEIRLSNGKVIQVSSEKGGLISADGLRYADGTMIQSTASQSDLTATIHTPAGTILPITLADGSEVTLNAKTTLKYPLHFANNERRVEIEGEVFFKIAKNKEVPFRVKSRDQLIEVTGTAFNVNTRTAKNSSQTTLVEGAINLSANGKKLRLKPNQQANLAAGQLSQKTVDPYNYIAWLDNKFYFNETELSTALQLIGQWYDLQIVYKHPVKETLLYGEIQRTRSLAAVLKILERSNIKFELIQENGIRKLYVSN